MNPDVGIQGRGVCVVLLGIIWSKYIQMCVSRCERDLWEGYLGVRMSGGSCVWTYVLFSVCTYIISCHGIWVWSVLDLKTGGLGSVVWMGLGVVCLGAGIYMEL